MFPLQPAINDIMFISIVQYYSLKTIISCNMNLRPVLAYIEILFSVAQLL
jgi:hypothetical protein